MGDLESFKSVKQEMEKTDALSKERELKQIYLDIKKEEKMCNQHQLILSTVKEVIKKKTKLTPTISKKVNDIIVAEEVAHFLQNAPQNIHQLGMFNICESNESPELLYDEATQLQAAVEDAVVEKCRNITLREKKRMLASRHLTDTRIPELGSEWDETVHKYNNSLVHGCTILKEMCDDCVMSMTRIHDTHANNLVTELQAVELKGRVLDLQVCEKIYFEHKDAMKAIEKIDISLKEDMDSLSDELEKLKMLKAAYDQLTERKDYQHILQEYLQVQKSIKDKKWLIKQWN